MSQLNVIVDGTTITLAQIYHKRQILEIPIFLKGTFNGDKVIAWDDGTKWVKQGNIHIIYHS